MSDGGFRFGLLRDGFFVVNPQIELTFLTGHSIKATIVANGRRFTAHDFPADPSAAASAVDAVEFHRGGHGAGAVHFGKNTAGLHTTIGEFPAVQFVFFSHQRSVSLIILRIGANREAALNSASSAGPTIVLYWA